MKTKSSVNTTSLTGSNWLPEQIGHYKIVSILGMGGMGVIYKAIQQPLNRMVALKVLPPQFSQDKESSLRFESEAKAISMLEHQNIVQIFEYGEENGMWFIAMQFVDGENLAQIIEEKKVMPIADVINYTKQICRGLRYAHGHNIIHRDIKPQNVLVDKIGVAKLTDFGIAKIISANDITMTGVTVGTPEYMSPEQASGQDLSTQTDIYSLGILVYEMLTKNPPFTANNPIAVAYKQVHELPLPPSLKRKDTPKRLELIVLKALKKPVEERYQSADEMLDHLDSVDLSERSDRTTVHFKAQTDADTGAADPASERRIVDRRSGDRRYGGLHVEVFQKHFWIDLVRTQWPLLVLIAGLYAIVITHILLSK